MCFSTTLYAQIDTVIQRTSYLNCNTTKTKLYIKVIGGKKPYTVKINTTNYSIKNYEDSIIINSGKYNGTVTDSLGYIKNVLFIVDTLKTPINKLKPNIYLTDSILNSNNKNKSINIQTSIKDASYHFWACNSAFANLTTTSSTSYNTLKIKPDISGKIIFTTMAMFGTCNTLQSNIYTIKVYPNIVKDTVLQSNTRRVYNIYGTLPITLQLEIDSVITSRVINTNRFVYDFDTTKSFSYIKIIDISDTSKLNTRVSIYDSYVGKKKENIIDSMLIFYEAFSPNNDGKNDYFHIGNYIDETTSDFKFIPGSLQVLDKNGFEVYNTEIYRNDWYGISNKNTELSDGVYYYIFKPKIITKSIPMRGSFVEIKRN